MTLTLQINDLPSRITRNLITQNSTIPGFREILRETNTNVGNGNSFITTVKNLFGDTVNVTGWVIGRVLRPIGLTFVNLFRSIVRASSFIYNFDWNISDNRLDQQVEALKLVIAGQLGEFFGNAAGYLACGVLPASAMLAVNEPLGLYLLANVGEEALDEFSDNLAALINVSFRSLATAITYKTFKNTRKAIKWLQSDKNPGMRKLATKIYGAKGVRAIESWGEANSKPWSLRIALEERVDSIEDPLKQEFTEEFTEEFADACVEAGYVVASSLDSWVIEQKQARAIATQQENIIELLPNRENERESIILQGNRQELQTQALSAINTYNLVNNRDVGEWVGEPLVDSATRPHKNTAIKILLSSVPEPPFIDLEGNRAKRVQIEIPNVDRSKLTWKRIKRAVGNSNGYMWGRFSFNVRLHDDNKINFYAASEEEGRKLLDELLELTDSKLLTLNIHEEKREGARRKYDKLYKQNTRVYPAHVVIINQYQLLTQNRGKPTTRGHKDHRQIKFPLYTSNEPLDFQILVDSLFVTPLER